MPLDHDLRKALPADFREGSVVERKGMTGRGVPAELISPVESRDWYSEGRWVATRGDQLVGVGSVNRVEGTELTLVELIVDPEFRGLGVGGSLFREIRADLGDDLQTARATVDALDARSVAIADAWGFQLPSPAPIDAFYLRNGRGVANISDAGTKVRLLKVEQLTADMLDRLRQLWLRAEEEPFVNEGITAEREEFHDREPARLRHGGRIAACFDGDQLVGALFASKCADVDEMYHELSFVAPEHRGKGVGSALKSAVIQSDTAGLLHFSTVQRDNRAIHRVHEKLGFKPYTITLASRR